MTTVVNVAQVAANMAVLGWGRRRAGVWTQGCDVGCPGCSSAHTHDTARGRIVAVNDMLEWFSAQASTFDGLTISGGEPTMQSDAVLELIEAFRSRFGEVDVLLFSGLGWPRISSRFADLVAVCDVVIAGPYVPYLPALPLRGSSNQSVHVLTRLGGQRYGDLDRWPVHVTQLAFGEHGVTTVGIPRTTALARRLQETRGFETATLSWDDYQGANGDVD